MSTYAAILVLEILIIYLFQMRFSSCPVSKWQANDSDPVLTPNSVLFSIYIIVCSFHIFSERSYDQHFTSKIIEAFSFSIQTSLCLIGKKTCEAFCPGSMLSF